MLEDNQEVLDRLTFARRKLFAPDIPLSLKAISYVRICCWAMKKLDYFPLEDRESNYHKTPYLSLLNSLSQTDSQWWDKCQVTDKGRLESDDPIIDRLLQPLNHFIDCQLKLNTPPENRRVDEQFKELSNQPQKSRYHWGWPRRISHSDRPQKTRY